MPPRVLFVRLLLTFAALAAASSPKGFPAFTIPSRSPALFPVSTHWQRNLLLVLFIFLSNSSLSCSLGPPPAPPRAPHPRGRNQVWLARWSHIWGLAQGPGPAHWGPDPALSLFCLCERQTNLLAPQASVSCSAQCGGDPYQICVCVPMN